VYSKYVLQGEKYRVFYVECTQNLKLRFDPKPLFAFAKIDSDLI